MKGMARNTKGSESEKEILLHQREQRKDQDNLMK